MPKNIYCLAGESEDASFAYANFTLTKESQPNGNIS